jgi:hypothetical protein
MVKIRPLLNAPPSKVMPYMAVPEIVKLLGGYAPLVSAKFNNTLYPVPSVSIVKIQPKPSDPPEKVMP